VAVLPDALPPHCICAAASYTVDQPIVGAEVGGKVGAVGGGDGATVVGPVTHAVLAVLLAYDTRLSPPDTLKRGSKIGNTKKSVRIRECLLANEAPTI
jgi:hypothetical protein